MTVALFPGSFDPFHRGHLFVVEWAARAYDEVIVGVLANPDKHTGLFSPDDRARLAGLATKHLGNVRCVTFTGVTGELAQQHHATAIVRSAHKEPELERLLAVLNKFLSGGVPTEYAPTDPDTESISSTAVRDLLLAGDVDAAGQLVPAGMRPEMRAAPRMVAHAPRPPAPAASPAPMGMGWRVKPVRVAAVQDTPVLSDRDATLDRTLTLTEQAAAAGAELVVFPEAFLPGYPDWVWRTRPWDDHARSLYANLFDNAIVVGSAATRVFQVAAKRFGIYLSVGVVEREPAGGTLFDSQLLFGPEGDLLAVHRRLVPAGGERLVWGGGDGSGLAVVETPFGRVGILSGWDNYMPLARAALYGQGVDIYLAPTWDDSAAWLATTRHIAREGRVFVVGVNSCIRAGDLPATLPGRGALYPDGQEWLQRGNTAVVDPGGDFIAGPLVEETGLVVADIDVNRARHLRQQFDPLGHSARPDVVRLRVERPPPSPAGSASG